MEEVLFNLPGPESPEPVRSPGILPPPTLGAFCCDECGGSAWSAEVASGSIVCMDCGACGMGRIYGSDLVSARPGGLVNAGGAEAAMQVAPGSRSSANSTSSNRDSYFTERLAQWAMAEPEIPDRHWEYITDAFEEYQAEIGLRSRIPLPSELRRSRGRQIAGTYLLTKDEIRTLLTRCDSVMAERGDAFDVGAKAAHANAGDQRNHASK